MKKWGKALREKEMQIAIEQRKTPKPLRFQGFLECKTNKDVCENPLFARLCGSAPLIFSFFRLGLGGFSAEGGF